MSGDRDILQQQITYYQERAAEYDEWFLRQGRYDRGEEHRRMWFAEVHQVEHALRDAAPRGDVLELACGTGLWTAHLARVADRVTAVDSAREVLQINRARVAAANVEYVEADLFSWTPAQRYDFVFFGFWLSHVPPERFDAFWRFVSDALRPGGQVFFVDGLFEQESTARDHDPLQRTGIVERKLNDGRRFRIVKVFYEPDALQTRLQDLGWRGFVRSTEHYFLYGSLAREASAA